MAKRRKLWAVSSSALQPYRPRLEVDLTSALALLGDTLVLGDRLRIVDVRPLAGVRGDVQGILLECRQGDGGGRKIEDRRLMAGGDLDGVLLERRHRDA